jgi:hypothetical protein
MTWDRGRHSANLGLREPLRLAPRRFREGKFAQPGAAYGAQAEFTTQSISGLMTIWTSRPFCFTTLYIEGENQAGV